MTLLNPFKKNSISPAKILILDDSKTALSLIEGIIQKMGLYPILANTMEEAIRLTKTEKPDLILLDVYLENGDGFLTLNTLHEENLAKGTPIIFISAAHNEENIIRGFRMGAVDFITKPFNAEIFEKRIHLHLSLNQQRKIIQEKNEKLEELNKTKDKFFSLLAHDLKNPFYAIQSTIEILHNEMEQLSEQEKKDYILELFHTSRNFGQLLQNLLEWSHQRMGAHEPQKELWSLQPLIERTISLLEPVARNKEIYIEKMLSDDLQIQADYNMLFSILRNLMSNAIKFTPRFGRVTISAWLDKRELVIQITDTGVGMTQEQINAVLQGNDVLSTIGTAGEIGTGLGLQLVFDFIKLNNGKLSVFSNPGKGTSFIMRFPAQNKNISNIPPLEKKTSPKLNSQTAIPIIEESLKDRNILLVDDLPINIMVAEKKLRTEGALVTTAMSGKQALSLVEHNFFHLIIMDIKMPDMNGLEIAQRIEKLISYHLNRYTPIIFLTAADQTEYLAELTKRGLTDRYALAQKPINISEIRKHFAVLQHTVKKLSEE